MDAKLRTEVDVIVRDRILSYHRGLIAKGQIDDIPVDVWTQLPTPEPTNRLASDCSQSEHTRRDDQQGDPIPPQAEPVRSHSGEDEHG